MYQWSYQYNESIKVLQLESRVASMADGKTRVVVTINDQNYTVLTDESSEYIQFIANAVDYKFQEINRSNSGLDTTRKAMLTALNIMDDYERLNQKYKVLNDKYRQVQSQIESQG